MHILTPLFNWVRRAVESLDELFVSPLIPATAFGPNVSVPFRREDYDTGRMCKGGGGAPPKQEPIKIPKMEPVVIPPPPPPPPPPPEPAPPPTQASGEALQAGKDTAAQERRRKGLAKTLLAGETGGYTADGKKTLLG